MLSRNAKAVDLDWECPRPGTLVAYTDGRRLGLIVRTTAGFELVDAHDGRIGTFYDFALAESKLAGLPLTAGSERSLAVRVASVLAVSAGVVVASVAAIAAISAVAA